ncbi:Mismatch repair-related protein [Mycena sanguinolenta]|uniref:RING-type E3 ubiquitin transferase n=1 Tax=Mycena sanguinolenta TaxID=230812 RepID=A0A8H6YC70_9AGAR|nr:Mismatch repair-related protein [Mycena sanguinolenta]
MWPVLWPVLSLLLFNHASAAPRFFSQSSVPPGDAIQIQNIQLKSKSERSSSLSWVLGWAWGAESTVSVVDRSPVVSFSSRPAAFGAEINDPILGYVIPLSSFTVPCNSSSVSSSLLRLPSNTACPSLCLSGPHKPDPNETWIALVQRGGGCEFVQKVREAQRLGARAVVSRCVAFDTGGNGLRIQFEIRSTADASNRHITLWENRCARASTLLKLIGFGDVFGSPDSSDFPEHNDLAPGDASDVKIASTFIRFADYEALFALIAASNTSHSGMRTLSLLITAEYSAWEWYSPIITFVIILLLPSILTFITLLIHRVRAARAAQRERAPEDVVHRLPWRVWTGSGWEKHSAEEDPYADEGDKPADNAAAAALATTAAATTGDAVVPLVTTADAAELSRSTPPAEQEPDLEQEPEPSSSQPPAPLAWFDTQIECAICLCEFEKGDKVRVLPCHHIFHLAEVDEWLITRKKLCPVCKADVTQPFGDDAQAAAAAPAAQEEHGREHSRPASPETATERTPLLADVDDS